MHTYNIYSLLQNNYELVIILAYFYMTALIINTINMSYLITKPLVLAYMYKTDMKQLFNLFVSECMTFSNTNHNRMI